MTFIKKLVADGMEISPPRTRSLGVLYLLISKFLGVILRLKLPVRRVIGFRAFMHRNTLPEFRQSVSVFPVVLGYVVV